MYGSEAFMYLSINGTYRTIASVSPRPFNLPYLREKIANHSPDESRAASLSLQPTFVPSQRSKASWRGRYQAGGALVAGASLVGGASSSKTLVSCVGE